MLETKTKTKIKTKRQIKNKTKKRSLIKKSMMKRSKKNHLKKGGSGNLKQFFHEMNVHIGRMTDDYLLINPDVNVPIYGDYDKTIIFNERTSGINSSTTEKMNNTQIEYKLIFILGLIKKYMNANPVKIERNPAETPESKYILRMIITKFAKPRFERIYNKKELVKMEEKRFIEFIYPVIKLQINKNIFSVNLKEAERVENQIKKKRNTEILDEKVNTKKTKINDEESRNFQDDDFEVSDFEEIDYDESMFDVKNQSTKLEKETIPLMSNDEALKSAHGFDFDENEPIP